jgi:hypothetical protein
MDIKQLVEQRNIYYDDIMAALHIVRAFIVNKNRILYGGMAIDLALKHAQEPGIYHADTLPDYDFWSPDFMADSIELADILFAEANRLGVKWDVSAINATHATTRRVRINFIPVADITYIPPNIYNAAPTLTVLIAPHVDVKTKVRIIHPDFQRMDIHRAFSTPLERPPLEVFFNRGAKDQHRGRLLAHAYPILLQSRPVIKHTTIMLEKPDSAAPDHVYGGLVAYAAYIMHWAAHSGFNTTTANKNYILPIELSVTSSTIKLSKWPLIPDIMTAPVTVISDEWQEFLPSNTNNTYMAKYLDDFCPRRVLSEHATTVNEFKSATEVFDNKGRRLPIQSIEVPGGLIRVACVQNVLLYLMQKAMAAREDEMIGHKSATESMWRAYYQSLELITTNSADPIFNLSTHMFGQYNVSADLLNSMHDKMVQIAGTATRPIALPEPIILPDIVDDADNMNSIVNSVDEVDGGGDDSAHIRPKFGYYPDSATEKPTFDPATSTLFAIDGRPCQPFEPTVYQFLSKQISK